MKRELYRGDYRALRPDTRLRSVSSVSGRPHFSGASTWEDGLSIVCTCLLVRNLIIQSRACVLSTERDVGGGGGTAGNNKDDEENDDDEIDDWRSWWWWWRHDDGDDDKDDDSDGDDDHDDDDPV